MRAFALVLLLHAVAMGPAYAQAPARINIYRYVLDIDVPESPGLVALDATGNHVLRGSSPKPIAASAVLQLTGSGVNSKGAAVDVVPYFLLGGGKRSLVSYRDMSVAGRLTRVVTKTSLSLAAEFLIPEPSKQVDVQGVKPFKPKP